VYHKKYKKIFKGDYYESKFCFIKFSNNTSSPS
jgi:hypothetical protein